MPNVYKQLAKQKFNNLILDESDNIKNRASKRAKALKVLANKIKYKIIMTWTPTRNKADEIYNQAELLFNNSVYMLNTVWQYYKYDRYTKDYELTRNPRYMQPFEAFWWMTNFRYCYCPKKLTVFWAEKTNQDVFNKKDLNRFMEPFRYARLFDDEKPRIDEVLWVESWEYDWWYQLNQVSIPMTPSENKVYQYVLTEFAKKMEEYYQKMHDWSTARMLVIMQQIMKLLAWVSHPWTFDDYDGPEETSKMKEANKVFSKARDESRKVMFWSPWVETIDKYYDYFDGKYTVFKIEQKQSKARRKTIIEEFKACPGTAILMWTIWCLKSGLNIPEASVVVTDSFTWNFATYKQFIARCIRLNSPEKVQVHALCNEGSFDLNVFALMLKKEKVNQFIRQGKETGDKDLMKDFDVSQDLFASAMKMVKVKVGWHVRWQIEWWDQATFTEHTTTN